MIIDTDVLIWYLRGDKNAFTAINECTDFNISAITYMELVQGMRSKKELYELRKAFLVWNTNILYLSEEISTQAMFLVEQFFLSHSVELADALIGATALVHGQTILTANVKHYKPFKNLQIKPFKSCSQR
jgi:predicted nucleic acid-binding protein